MPALEERVAVANQCRDDQLQGAAQAEPDTDSHGLQEGRASEKEKQRDHVRRRRGQMGADAGCDLKAELERAESAALEEDVLRDLPSALREFDPEQPASRRERPHQSDEEEGAPDRSRQRGDEPTQLEVLRPDLTMC